MDMNVTASVNFTRNFAVSITPSINFTMSTINSSLNYSLMASSVTPNSTVMVVSRSSSISVPYKPWTNELIRTINVTVKIFNERFSVDLISSNTSAYTDLSKRVRNAFDRIFSEQPGYINITDIKFSNGSVVVNFQANFNLTSNMTALDAKTEIINRNGSRNIENFIFSSDVKAFENCSTSYCLRGNCQMNNVTGAYCM
ncbi:uncharacterized protein LOC116298304 [Actinia tenebrosa]|uniref:Uncharacterized protein LOC116298304 n=1 Tax=Actinia tenebrosa TaxID=6105 RepID=A0A6P8I3W0_ACTTE|nr:uncharacterized protein LOC116298304 [Actinia tenebrosa]